MKRNQLSLLIASILIVTMAAARVANAEMHIYNFAPVAALGLFSGAVIKDKRVAFLMAIMSQFLGDVYFQLFTKTPGFYDLATQLFTYGGLLAATFLGTRMQNVKTRNVLGYTIGSSMLFFIISNFGVWLGGWNGKGLGALAVTYINAIPFFKYSIIGDMAGSVLLFGSYFLLQNALAGKLEKAKA